MKKFSFFGKNLLTNLWLQRALFFFCFCKSMSSVHTALERYYDTNVRPTSNNNAICGAEARLWEVRLISQSKIKRIEIAKIMAKYRVQQQYVYWRNKVIFYVAARSLAFVALK